ncbi:hypothetical protein M9H77_16844 [Catharanthus roseus]|uniref:Uncharacterized protein n=1 Tax=Catharanthus roseus TaxID=4058 RepID=A0ACC0B2V4_CATRO|nr:hypothetical protein M9H77_16844 [Catharanthus roseus]
MESLMVEEFPNIKELSQAKIEDKSLCMQNFEDPSKDEDGKLTCKSIKTLNFFPSKSYLIFEIYFMEIKPNFKETRSEKRSLVYYKLFFNFSDFQFQIQATVNNSRNFLTTRPFRSRIWTPTVEDERAQRVQFENPQYLTVRCVLPVKNRKLPQ